MFAMFLAQVLEVKISLCCNFFYYYEIYQS